MMSDPVSLEEARQRRANALADISGSAGGGHDGGMSELERRVGALEKQVAVVETKVDLVANGREMGVDIKSLGKALGDLTGKVSQLPSTWTMAGWFVTVSIALTGLVFTIARAMK